MAFRVRKTEHSGAKHGRGALWGTKYEAKSQSGKVRRRNSKSEIQEQSTADGAALERLLLLSGIPASGKSTYGQWLADNKGFLFLDAENEGSLDGVGLRPLWNSMFSPGAAVVPFVQALRQLGQPIALDWGFPPACLPVIEALKHAGFEIWWFDGDRAAARQSFITRNTVPIGCFDLQIQNIDKYWRDIKRVFGDHVIETIAAGSSYLDHRQIRSERESDKVGELRGFPDSAHSEDTPGC